MQLLGSLNDPTKEAKVFIRDICKLNLNDVDEIHQLVAYQEWLLSLDFSMDEAPSTFKLDEKTFKTCQLQLRDRTIETPLNMQLRFLIELVNLEIDVEKYQSIDNVAALIYREDWNKPFDQSEYFNNAIMFEKAKCKYSFWGMQKFKDLIVTLKNTYPILYQNNTDEKEDVRKLYQMLNAISGDIPANQIEAENIEIYRAFEWMEEKKKEAIKRKLNKR